VLILQTQELNSERKLASYARSLQKQGIIPQLAAVFLGTAFCSAIGVWFIAKLLAGDLISTGVLGFAYLLFTLTYSVIASLSFRPKRFVSPTHIQIVTIPIMFALILDIMFWKGVTLTSPTWEGFASAVGATLALMMFALLVSAYLVLSPIARYLVGLIGTKDDLLVTQFLVHANHTKILGELLDGDFQYTLGIKEQEEVRHGVWVLRTEGDAEQQMFVIVCPDSTNRDFTQVVIVSYELARYGIAPTTRARAVHELNAKEIKARFRNFKVDYVRLDKSRLMPALAVAYENALACTESKILAMRKLSAQHKAIIVSTVAILVAVGLLGWIGKITPDLTESGFLLIGIAMIFEFFPAIKLKRGSRVF
jgi:hypothetical protein